MLIVLMGMLWVGLDYWVEMSIFCFFNMVIVLGCMCEGWLLVLCIIIFGGAMVCASFLVIWFCVELVMYMNKSCIVINFLIGWSCRVFVVFWWCFVGWIVGFGVFVFFKSIFFFEILMLLNVDFSMWFVFCVVGFFFLCNKCWMCWVVVD